MCNLRAIAIILTEQTLITRTSSNMGGVAFSSLNALAANETLIKMYMSTIKPQPWPTFEGVKYPSFIPFRMKGIDNHIRDVMNFKSRETDILITTYSKSGKSVRTIILSFVQSLCKHFIFRDKFSIGSWFMIWFMSFNATFNNISFLSWRNVLLEEKTRVPGENHRPVASL